LHFQENFMKTVSLSLLAAFPVLVGCVNDESAGAQVTEPLSAGAAQRVPVYFNHSYGLMSEATVSALQTNAYLNNQFIDVEVRTTVRPDLTYTGTYLNTRETYLEFFPVGTFGFPAGVTGLALGDEVEGGLEAIRDEWIGAFGADQVDPITLTSREVNGVVVPWFNMTAPVWGDVSAFTGVWAMQYVANPNSTAPRTRHEERASRYQPTKLAQNVQAMIYGLPDGDRQNMQNTLAAVGWTVAPASGGFVAVSPIDTGTRRVIYAKPAAEGRTGMLAVIWRLNRAAQPHTEQIGDAVLTVAPARAPYASLWFVPAAPNDEARALAAAE
jgi:hypothetical protein